MPWSEPLPRPTEINRPLRQGTTGQPARRLAVDAALEAGYRAMAADQEREAEAMEWINGLVGYEAKGP